MIELEAVGAFVALLLLLFVVLNLRNSWKSRTRAARRTSGSGSSCRAGWGAQRLGRQSPGPPF